MIDILITLNSTELGKNIKWHILIIHETPGDEVQLPPVVGLTARHHELPVRNLSATEIQDPVTFSSPESSESYLG